MILRSFWRKEAIKLQKAATNTLKKRCSVTQPLLTSMLSRTPYSKDSVKQKRITEKLAIFISSANVATTLVEDQEFCEFLHEMDARYIVPGRTAITTELSKAVLKLKRNISKELKSARKINLCCDIWSKKGMTESYLGVTAHFSANHQRCKVTLAVRHFESPHIGDRILNIIKVVLNDWDISCSQVGKIVIDNGSNMLNAFKETINCSNDDSMTDTEYDVLVVNLPENEDEETNCNGHDDQPEVNDIIENVIEFDDNEEHNEIITREEYQRLSCFSHTLQLIVAKFDDVKPCKEAISICKKLVACFNKSVNINVNQVIWQKAYWRLSNQMELYIPPSQTAT